MRNLLMLFLASVTALCMHAQDFFEADSYCSSNTIIQYHGLPVVRPVYGGTKFIVLYEGNWSEDMKGAFDYACKIWEESMPTTFPIKIHAILDEEESTALSTFLSNTVSHGDVDFSYAPFSTTSTWTQIKGTKFDEFSGMSDTRIYDNIITNDMFEEPDITINYHNKDGVLESNCSFSLEDTPIPDKYDFVSVVLRDIAKAFGIQWNIKASRNVFRINRNRILPYEQYILNKIETNGAADANTTIMNATSGSIDIGDYSTNTYRIYAPTTWNEGISLNYFVPNDNQKITRLLSYNFGKGSVNRDIASSDTYKFFRDILRWKGEIAVGTGSVSSTNGTTTDYVIPFNGNISLTNSRNKEISFHDSIPNSTNSKNLNSTMIGGGFEDILPSVEKYHPNYHPNADITQDGWFVSLLLKDGTWDEVYSFPIYTSSSFTVSTKDFHLNNPIDSYARSCDGYLRCRVSESHYDRYGIVNRSHYYIIDYLPQNVKMKVAKVQINEYEPEYYRDIKIALKDLEGATKIVVSQLDEWNDVPYSYEIPDFKKGYFTATVDRDYTSTFTIYAYNKNGERVSSPYVVTSVDPTPILLDFKYDKDKITVNLVSSRNEMDNYISYYMIASLSNSKVPIMKKVMLNTNTIDVSNFPSGIYLLAAYDKKGAQHLFRFVR